MFCLDSPSSPSLRVERDDNVEDVIRVSNPRIISFSIRIVVELCFFHANLPAGRQGRKGR